MKLIQQSHELLDDLEDPVQQIGKRARICYQSEIKASKDETKFVKSLRKRKHHSCMEMAVLHLQFPARGGLAKLEQSKYLLVSFIEDDTKTPLCIVSGTVRAFQEYLGIAGTAIAKDIGFFLSLEYPTLFDFMYPFKDYSVDLFDPSLLDLWEYTELYKKHVFQAVKFVTNRAVSHELVRHRPVSYLQESQRYCAYKGDISFISPTAFSFGEEREDSNPAHAIAFAVWISACTTAELVYHRILKETGSAQAARTVLPNSCKTEIIVYCSLKQWEHIFFLRCSSAADPSMQEAMFPVWEAFRAKYPDLKPRRLE